MKDAICPSPSYSSSFLVSPSKYVAKSRLSLSVSPPLPRRIRIRRVRLGWPSPHPITSKRRTLNRFISVLFFIFLAFLVLILRYTLPASIPYLHRSFSSHPLHLAVCVHRRAAVRNFVGHLLPCSRSAPRSSSSAPLPAVVILFPCSSGAAAFMT